MTRSIWWAAGGAALSACTLAMAQAGGGATGNDELRQEVMAVERAFARTMADRDHRAFAEFIADEAVFFSGPAPLRGKEQVVAWWGRFYQGPRAPFSWAPEEVEVLASGALALSSGPVHDADGRPIGRFTSVWRLEAPGRWRIVFDKGSPACDCPGR
ncbi:nuclear transport factor 2 family protein [Ramlibacter sp.]|uniref:YybH family protein n=1 Tax=Ramlibacter sp. TaxID=1917967 RepID=UPI002CF8E881|nr:nuclear transport factor 2 family protein [Ramlibacter sp.]HWI81594.1 nuclear transport factor 2 family protein [Ramlibacter sp.]